MKEERKQKTSVTNHLLKKKNNKKFSQQFFCPFSSFCPKHELFLKSSTREQTVNTLAQVQHSQFVCCHGNYPLISVP